MVFTSPYPDLSLPQGNILDHLFPEETTVSDQPKWTDCSDPQKSVSMQHLFQYVKRLGCGLQKIGFKKGDTVFVCTTNHVYVPAVYLGVIGIGCVFSGSSPAYTIPELAHQLADISPKAILVHPDRAGSVLEAATKAGFRKESIFLFSDETGPETLGLQDWKNLFAPPADSDAWRWPEFSPQEARTTIATVNYSSGTTGLPKGVCISHANLVANLEQAIYAEYAKAPCLDLKDRPAERWVGFLPLSHSLGQFYTILLTAKLNVQTYMMPAFHFEKLLSAISDFRITQLQIVPTVMTMLCKRQEPSRYNLSSVEEILCGAAPLSLQLQRECQEKFGVRVMQGFGMTELTCTGLMLSGGLGDEGGSVGWLHPNMEGKLLDDEGKEVGIGESGELYLRGPNICMGYWRNEIATKETLDAQGWLKTGDVALCNDRGQFWIVVRKKELIKVNGLQVSPAELEAVLLGNEHVAEAAVVGVKISDGTEWPRAYVVPQPTSGGRSTPEGIQSWVAGRVAKHKRLSGGVVFVEEVPKLPSGKIVRKILREWARRDAEEVELLTKTGKHHSKL